MYKLQLPLTGAPLEIYTSSRGLILFILVNNELEKTDASPTQLRGIHVASENVLTQAL